MSEAQAQTTSTPRRPLERVSKSFLKCATEKRAGDDLLVSARLIVNAHRNRGVPKHTLQRWHDAGWCVVTKEKQGRESVVVACVLTPEGERVWREVVAREEPR